MRVLPTQLLLAVVTDPLGLPAVLLEETVFFELGLVEAGPEEGVLLLLRQLLFQRGRQFDLLAQLVDVLLA